MDFPSLSSQFSAFHPDLPPTFMINRSASANAKNRAQNVRRRMKSAQTKWNTKVKKQKTIIVNMRGMYWVLLYLFNIFTFFAGLFRTQSACNVFYFGVSYFCIWPASSSLSPSLFFLSYEIHLFIHCWRIFIFTLRIIIYLLFIWHFVPWTWKIPCSLRLPTNSATVQRKRARKIESEHKMSNE